VSSILQMTTVMHSLGIAIGPQVTAPFLGHKAHVSIANSAGTNVTIPAQAHREGLAPVQVAYLVVGALNVGMAVVCIIACAWFGVGTGQCNSIREVLVQGTERYEDIELIVSNDSKPATSYGTIEPAAKIEPEPRQVEPCSRPGSILLAIMFLSFFMDAGRSVLYMGLLYTYLYEYLGWSVQASTLLVTMFNLVSFVVGFVMVPVARWASPTTIMVVDLASILTSAVLMLLALGGTNHASVILTASGVIVAAVGDCNMLTSLISLAEEAIHVVAWVMAFFMSTYCLSLVIVGPVTGFLLHTTVMAYPAMLLALAVSGTVLFVVYLVALRCLKLPGRHS